MRRETVTAMRLVALAVLGACGGGAAAAPTCAETVAALGDGRVDNKLVDLCERWTPEQRSCLARSKDPERCLPMPVLPLSLIVPSVATRQLVSANPQHLSAKLFVDLANPHDAAAARYVKSLMDVELVTSLPDHVIRLFRGNQWIEVPIDPTDKIAFLDKEVATALAHLHDTRHAYYVLGHGEVPLARQQQLISALLLEHVEIREGTLLKPIPDDAALVMVIGPVTSIANAEYEMLGRYLTRGGKLIIALDPPYDLFGLAPMLGVRLDPSTLRDNHAPDNENIVVSSVGKHPTIGAHRLTMLAHGAGALSPYGVSAAKVTFTLASPISSWRDVNGNHQLDLDEPPQSYPVGAASDGYAFRALVFGDSSIWSDALPIQAQLPTMLAWLLGQDHEIEIADAAVPSATLLEALAARKATSEAHDLAARLILGR